MRRKNGASHLQTKDERIKMTLRVKYKANSLVSRLGW